MPVTQTRTFVYSDAGLLTSATNPENGTVSYYYNTTNTLQRKHDAKGQDFIYTYDSANRVIEIQKYPLGQSNAEDVCAQVNYVYGVGETEYNYGRLISASTLQVQGTCTSAPSYSESYSYDQPGDVVSKTVTSSAAPCGSTPVSISYTYDSYGRPITVQYPFQGTFFNYVKLTTTYDTMGRPNGLTDSNGNTWVNSAGYDYAGRPQTLNHLGVAETRTYNTLGQIATIGWTNSNSGQPAGTLTYMYSATQNNGQITQATDGLTGETTSYQYDALKRLTSASNSAWNESFSYDGFGNLTGKTLNGTLQSISVNSATNQLSGPTYDYNGNMTVGTVAPIAYNEDNRMSSAQESSGSVEYYYYTPDGKRFYRQTAVAGTPQFTLYGAHGEALGTYANSSYLSTNPSGEISVYFGGRRLWQGPYYSSSTGSQGALFADRLGSNRYVTSSPGSGSYYIANYYPYGDAAGTAPQDQVGFATYSQDSYTGLSYANQRMYASTYGRFNTPDPYMASAKGTNDPTTPGSWNRYAYVLGDPVNNRDSRGTDLEDCPEDGCGDDWYFIDDDGSQCELVDGLPECQYYPFGIGVATTLGTSGAFSYSAALGAWQSAQKWVANTALKPGCDSLEQALGITGAAWQSAAGAEQFFNGLTATAVQMTSLFAGAAVPGTYANAVQQFGSESVADFLSSRDNGPEPGAAAVSYLGAPLVFLDYKDINPGNFYVNASNVLHEALHNLLGLTDQGIQLILSRAGFNIQVSSNSSNISTLIAQKCF